MPREVDDRSVRIAHAEAPGADEVVVQAVARRPSYGAAKESNLPTRGLHGPAGFEVRGFDFG
jgi:hypothetical protein